MQRVAPMLLLIAVACAPSEEERVAQSRHALDAPLAEAYCDAEVDGIGAVPTETDYLPHVIACENGGADLEALKAQAVAARSVLYWTLGTHGSICNTQACQVYSCANEPTAIHQQAVDETSGEYLAFNGNVTYGFYVNGDSNTAPPECVGDPGAQNEGWITYNEGLSGTDVEQTALGFQHDPSDSGYGQNRGCQGQWGARCLESQGHDYDAILRFYYGADIEVLRAPGPCIIPDEMGGAGGTGGADGAGGATVATSASSSDSSATSSGSGGADGGGEPDDADDACSCRAAGGSNGEPWAPLSSMLAMAAIAVRRLRSERA